MASISLPVMGVESDWNLGEDGWKPGVDKNWLILDSLSHLTIAAYKPATLPVMATDGDRIIQLDNLIAVRKLGAWVPLTPSIGMTAADLINKVTYQYDGTGWNIIQATVLEVSAPLSGVSTMINGSIALDITDPNNAVEYISINEKWYATGRAVDTVTGLYTESFIFQSEKGVANGVASLDAMTKVPMSELLTDVPTGVPTLDTNSKIQSSHLPFDAMEYKATYDATTNTPILVDGTGDIGDLYRVSVAGTQDLGSGPIDFFVGDRVVYNSTGTWERWDGSDVDQKLGDHLDVDLVTPPISTATILGYDAPNSKWVRSNPVVGNSWSHVPTSLGVLASPGDFVQVDATAGAITVTLPTAIGNAGNLIQVGKNDSTINNVTIDPNGAETINSRTEFVLISVDEVVTLVSNGVQWNVQNYHAPNAFLDVLAANVFPWPTGTAAFTARGSILLPIGTWSLSGNSGSNSLGTAGIYTFRLAISELPVLATDHTEGVNQQSETISGAYDNPKDYINNYVVQVDTPKTYYVKVSVDALWATTACSGAYLKATKVG